MDQYRTGPQQNDVDIEFIADYENGLSELTFNSKPLINTLTIIAGENLKAASHVVKIIETKIRLVCCFKLTILICRRLNQIERFQ